MIHYYVEVQYFTLAMRVFRVASGAQGLGQEEEGSQEFLYSHHSLGQVLYVHVRHLGRLCPCDPIMVLYLEIRQRENNRTIEKYWF